MAVNRLALFVALSVYLYVGTFFEERRLVDEFGDEYRAYKSQMPRMIPIPWARRWRGPVGGAGAGREIAQAQSTGIYSAPDFAIWPSTGPNPQPQKAPTEFETDIDSSDLVLVDGPRTICF